MTSRLTVNKFIIYLVLIAFTAGCTTMRSLPATDAQSATGGKNGDYWRSARNCISISDHTGARCRGIESSKLRFDGVYELKAGVVLQGIVYARLVGIAIEHGDGLAFHSDRGGPPRASA